MHPFKGQILFVLLSKAAISHNRTITRSSGGTEWGKLAAAATSAHSVLGEGRNVEMCFLSFLNICRALLTSGASELRPTQYQH